MLRSRRTSVIPTRCVERHPTKQTVSFVGVPLNLSRLSRSIEPPISTSFLSLVFSGQRMPRVDTARILAEALGMQLQAFLDALAELEQTPVGQ